MFDDMSYSGKQLFRDARDKLHASTKLAKKEGATVKGLMVLPYHTEASKTLLSGLADEMVDQNECIFDVGSEVPQFFAGGNALVTRDKNNRLHKHADAHFSVCEAKGCGQQFIWMDHKLADWVSIKTHILLGFLPDKDLKGDYDASADDECQRLSEHRFGTLFQHSDFDPWSIPECASPATKSIFFPPEPYKTRLSKARS
jgi:hypothetical protein